MLLFPNGYERNPINSGSKRYVPKQCVSNHTHWNFSPTNSRPEKCVQKQYASNHTYQNMFLISIEKCNEATHIKPVSFFYTLTTSRPKRCALERLRKTHETWPMSLITSKPMRYVMMQYVETHIRWNLFLNVTLNCNKCGMRTLITMMKLISNVMTINNARPRKHK